MKKIIFCFMTIFLSFGFLPLIAQEKSSNSSYVELKPVEAKVQKQSLNEKINLKSSKKKNSQQIVVQSENRYHRHGGVYISVGGGLLLLLLLIILL